MLNAVEAVFVSYSFFNLLTYLPILELPFKL